MQNMLPLCTSMIFGPSMRCFCIFYHLPGKLPRLIDLQAAQFVQICSTNSASLTKVYFLGFVQITSMNSVVVLVIMIIAYVSSFSLPLGQLFCVHFSLHTWLNDKETHINTSCEQTKHLVLPSVPANRQKDAHTYLHTSSFHLQHPEWLCMPFHPIFLGFVNRRNPNLCRS